MRERGKTQQKFLYAPRFCKLYNSCDYHRTAIDKKRRNSIHIYEIKERECTVCVEIVLCVCLIVEQKLWELVGQGSSWY